jgi:hypothetical protein
MSQGLDSVVLTTDLPGYGIEQGNLGSVVLVHRAGKGYEVEFVTLDGETVARAHHSKGNWLPSGGRPRAPTPLGGYPLSIQPPKNHRFTVFFGRYALHYQLPFAFAAQ